MQNKYKKRNNSFHSRLLKRLLLVFIASVSIISCCNDDDIIIDPETPPEDVNTFSLGILPLINTNTFVYNFVTTEPSETLTYSFTIENSLIVESTDYLITSSYENVLLTLKDDEGNIIVSGEGLLTNQSPYDFISSGATLPTNQLIYLELKNTGTEFNNRQLNITFRNSNHTDFGRFWLEPNNPKYGSVPFSFDNEPDDKIRFEFEIEFETSRYFFEENNDFKLTLFDSEGNSVGEKLQDLISGSALAAGRYALEILNSAPYENNEGSFSFYLYPNTDVDLGEIIPPFRETRELTIFSEEPDNKIVYTFSINNFASYFIYTQENVELTLKDEDGTIIASGVSFIGNAFRDTDLSFGAQLDTQKIYQLEIIDPTGNGIEGQIDFTFRDDFETDLNLGVLNVPSDETYNFEIANGEPDHALFLSFEIESAATITVPGIENLGIYLEDSNNQVIQRALGANETISVNLTPGQYRFDIIADVTNSNPNVNIAEQLQITLTNE
ncbi:hypothetical protein [Aquimarina brevivitae]|uniref:Ig-like domain-containing protein n=1 Tax=Aquimarina brevivitae TaxID=323412 RepID=A0A4V2F4U1_9FLAO|nr:hypothetical protein [Aquimarina brevivitae]RZS90499.1 hypothetical protein EV197_3488 [Aquimarina brevivitae]